MRWGGFLCAIESIEEGNPGHMKSDKTSLVICALVFGDFTLDLTLTSISVTHRLNPEVRIRENCKKNP